MTQTHWIPKQRIEQLLSAGPQHSFYDLQLLSEVLNGPTAIFQGLREGQEGGLCFAGLPEHRFTNGGDAIPKESGLVFLAFSTVEGKIIDWRWEKEDPTRPGFPRNWSGRFRRVIWPKS